MTRHDKAFAWSGLKWGLVLGDSVDERQTPSCTVANIVRLVRVSGLCGVIVLKASFLDSYWKDPCDFSLMSYNESQEAPRFALHGHTHNNQVPPAEKCLHLAQICRISPLS